MFYLLERQARQFTKHKHQGQIYGDNEDFYEAHIKPVVNLVKQVTDDKTTIIAAYLHDTLEDTNTSYEELAGIFGEEVASVVQEVTKTGYNKFPQLRCQKAYLIKFADRLSNLSKMDAWNKYKQQKYLNKSIFWQTS